VDQQLTDKIAVITGGSRGIGRAIASGMAAEGATVVISSRSEPSCADAAAELRDGGAQASGIACDVTEASSVDALFARVAAELGGCDIFIHCAGLSSVGLAKDVDQAALRQMLEVHYLGGVHACQQARAQMAARGGGAILLVSSVWALGGQPASLAYGAAKAALAHSVKVMSIEWARYGIRVNGLAPGFVDTDMTAEMDEGTRERLVKRIPLRRSATPDEMAGPAIFLCGPMASYVTGHLLVADGGERAR